MDRRLIIIIAAVVVAAHALFLVLRLGKEDDSVNSRASQGEVPDGNTSQVSASEGTDPEAPTSPPETEPPYELLSGATPRSNEADTPPDRASEEGLQKVPVDAKAIPKGQIPEGSISVGLHSGTTKLPPEVAEMAKRGALAVSDQKWEEARDAYLEMVNAVPENALAYANLGVAEFQLGNLVAASGNLKRSLELNSSIANNWQTLGLIQYELRDLNLAISSLTRAIHESPRDAQARVYLAAVIRDYGWTEAALIELKRAVDIDPKLADAHYNLAVTYLETSPPKVELARRHYYNAIDLGAAPSPELEETFKAAE